MSQDQYQHITYGAAMTVTAEPSNRAEDVMYYLITGQLMGERSLDGVTWEVETEGPRIRS